MFRYPDTFHLLPLGAFFKGKQFRVGGEGTLRRGGHPLLPDGLNGGDLDLTALDGACELGHLLLQCVDPDGPVGVGNGRPRGEFV